MASQVPDGAEDAADVSDLPDGSVSEGTEVSEAIWALWNEVERLRVELELGRHALEREARVASEAAAHAIDALRIDLARPRAPAYEGDDESPPEGGSGFPYALLALPGQVNQLQIELTEERAERRRADQAFPGLIRAEIGRMLASLDTERVDQESRSAAFAESLRTELELLRQQLRETPRTVQEGGGDPPALHKVVRAALDDVRHQLVEERNQREERDASIMPALRAVHDGLEKLRSSVDVERAEVGQRQAQWGEALVAQLATQFGEMRAELAADRSEQGARDGRVAELSNAIATIAEVLHEVGRGIDEERAVQAAAVGAFRAADADTRAALEELREVLATQARAVVDVAEDLAGDRNERVRRDADVASALAAVKAQVGALGDELVEDRLAREERDAPVPVALAGLQSQLGELREELALDRRRRDESEATGPAAVAALEAQVGAFREEFAEDLPRREKFDAAILAAATAVQTQLTDVREELFEERRRGEEADAALKAQLGELHEYVDAAIPAAVGTVQTALGEVREDLVQDLLQREARDAALQATLDGQREALGAVQEMFLETRREQEALAFQLPEATRGMQEHVDTVHTKNIETLQQLETMLRTTMAGANTWFARTRDELVERIDRLAATADLGIAESMVEVLEHVRGDLLELRVELAALRERPQLTAAQVRKIVRDTLAEPPKAAGANGKAAKATKATKARPSRGA